MSRAVAVALAALAGVTAAGCGDNLPVRITVYVPAADASLTAAVREMTSLTGYRGFEIKPVADPRAAVLTGGTLRIAVVTERTCTECYSVDGADFEDRAWVVNGGDLLGAQYGLAHALENLGFRFRHPDDTYVPDPPTFDGGARGSLFVVHRPAQQVRGFQFHTLHPIEGYYAFWEPGAAHQQEARRILDWTIKNRGNYVQWVGVNDILDPVRHAEWQASTRAILDAAHARGLRAGLNLQLYGQSNLQLAFDLWHDPAVQTLDAALAERVPLVTQELPFDAYELSFGEFFNADPDAFIHDVDAVYAAFHAAAPAAQFHALVHVGADQRVTYMGEDLIYYFLVKYCDPHIVPDVHTVMFYDLYEDTGGAYHHDNFAEHRLFILDRLRRGLDVTYFPETAYWVAFDDSVPLFLPLYVRNRWLDLTRLAEDAAAQGSSPLPGQLLFSSGWEWGYWLNDYTALRASFERPADYPALIANAFGQDLAPAVDVVVALADLQQRTLQGQRLTAYLAGRDGIIDVGRNLNIASQPDRTTFADLAMLQPELRLQFVNEVLQPLGSLADQLDALAARARALDLPDSRWARELVDGVEITDLRARFVFAVYSLSLATLGGDRAEVSLRHDEAKALLERARAVVARRGRDLHAPDPATLLHRGANHTLYGYGYLYNADTLCYWVRELRQVEQQASLGTEPIPDCLL